MPPIPYKRPDYMDPSVTDSWWTWAKRQVGTLVGADDPAGSVMGMVGAVEIPAAKAATAAKQAIKAYHGSPHDFERFSLDKIGTGEGGQAYGHGLYFAENEATAKAYREKLADTAVAIGGREYRVQSWDANMGAHPRVVRRLADRRATMPNAADADIVTSVRATIQDDLKQLEYQGQIHPNDLPRAEAYRRELEILDDAEAKGIATKHGGKMYEVNLNVSPDELLDWDKPLSEQSPKVREVLHKSWLAHPEAHAGQRGSEIYRQTVIGEAARADLPDRAGHVEGLASKRLNEAGIKGIQYLDAGSRAAGEGTKNFVIFDDSLISIARKYGIPLAVLAGPTGRAMVEALAKRDAQQQAAQEKMSSSRARYLPNR